MIKNFVRLSAIIALGTILVATTPTALAQTRVFDPAVATATSTAAAATVNKQSGIITTEALSTAAGADYSFTLTSDKIESTSAIIYAWCFNGTNTATGMNIGRITVSAGSAIIIVHNGSAGALNGTIKIGFVVLSPGA